MKEFFFCNSRQCKICKMIKVLTVGALHQADPVSLRLAASAWHDELDPLPKPLLIVNIGGPTSNSFNSSSLFLCSGNWVNYTGFDMLWLMYQRTASMEQIWLSSLWHHYRTSWKLAEASESHSPEELQERYKQVLSYICIILLCNWWQMIS